MIKYVYSAGIGPKFECNKKSIKAARKAIEHLEYDWNTIADITGYWEGVNVKVTEPKDGITGNIEICFSCDDISRLIDNCMRFARYHERYLNEISVLQDV